MTTDEILTAQVRELEAEVERLRRLLRDDHRADCSALVHAVPCDCPWASGEATSDELRAEIAGLRAAARDAADELDARHAAICAPVWSAYGRCEPNAPCHLADLLRAALGGEEPKP